MKDMTEAFLRGWNTKKVLIIPLTLLCMACTTETTDFEVAHYGVLREVMMEQKLESNADLNSFQNKPNLYALGALEQLSGELIILEGKPFKATVNNGHELEINNDMSGGVTLLVASEVREWIEIPIDQNLKSLSELQEMVKELAEQNALDTDEPFPFLLEGTLSSFQWHVINAPNAVERTHEAFKKSGISGDNFQEKARVLGFYSTRHEGVFTHHGSYIHAHVLTDNQQIAGHIDDLTISNKIILKLPKIK